MAEENINVNINLRGTAEIDNAVRALGDIKKELSSLMKTPTFGMAKADIEALNNRIGALKNELKDTSTLARAMDKQEFLNNMVQGLRGAISAVQLFGAGMKMLGMETETAKKLEAATLQLISATQALSVIMELRNKGIFTAIGLQIKQIATTAANVVVNWAETMAEMASVRALQAKTTWIQAETWFTKIATAASWAFNAALAVTGAWISAIAIGVLALVSGIVYLTTRTEQLTKEEERQAKALEAVNDAMIKGAAKDQETIVKLQLLTKVAENFTLSLKERQMALNELNNIMGTHLTLQDNITAATQKYVEVLVISAQLDSVIKSISEINNKLADEKILLDEASLAWYDRVLAIINTNEMIDYGADKLQQNYDENIKQLNETKTSLTIQANELLKKMSLMGVTNSKATQDQADQIAKMTNDLLYSTSLTIEQLNKIIALNYERSGELDRTDAIEKSILNSLKMQIPVLEDINSLQEDQGVILKENQATIDDNLLNNAKAAEAMNQDQIYLYESKLEREKEINRMILSMAESTSNAVNDIWRNNQQAIYDDKVEKLEDSFDKEKQALDDTLKANLITQQEYDKKISNIEKKKEAELKILKQQNWEKQHQADIIMAVIKAALGVLTSLAEGGPYLAAAAAVAGAAEVAVINSQPTPKFAQGIVDFMGQGTSTSDSNLVRISRGESIINAAATQQYKPVLQAMNQGGSVSMINKDDLRLIVSEVARIPVINSVDDTQKTTDKIRKIRNRVTF